MKISLDTNILSGFLYGTAEGQRDMQALREQQRQGATLLICGPVYVELCGARGTDRANIDAFLKVAHIQLDLAMPTAVWEKAADANQTFQERRRSSGSTTARRVAADFLIGAHALHRADALFTRNPSDFADFPGLTLLIPR